MAESFSVWRSKIYSGEDKTSVSNSGGEAELA